MKFNVFIDCDYVMGYLRYGHLEGVIEADTEEQAKEIALNNQYDLDLVIDDYSVDDYEIDKNSVTVEVIE